jgi:hypothetical protein
VTEELAFFLGAYASGGSISKLTATVRISNADMSVLERVRDSALACFGSGAVIRTPGNRGCFVELASKTAVELLEYLGCGTRAADKRVPDAILQSPRATVLAFLQGLAIDARVGRGASPKWAIGVASPGLLDDLQALLANLGVLTDREARPGASDEKSSYDVSASGEHAKQMISLAPFLPPEKQSAAMEVLEGSTSRSSGDVVPCVSGPQLLDLVRRAQSDGHMAEELDFVVDWRARYASRQALERVAAIPGTGLPAKLKWVLDLGLHFSPVVSVADAGVQQVFDLSVPGSHSFVGNGIVNHNTVNMPEDVTVEEVEQLHIEAWQMGIKAVAIYRDNCKVAQPLATAKKTAVSPPPASDAEAHDAELALKVAELEKALQLQTVVVKKPVHEHMPRKRKSSTFSFRVADCEGYVTVGEFPDGRPGEVFISVSKQGSTLAGIMDAFAISVSMGLQHGVPLATFVRHFTNMRFEPAGMTDDPDLRFAASLVDYIFRRLAVEYMGQAERMDLGILTVSERMQPTLPGVEEAAIVDQPIRPDLVEEIELREGRAMRDGRGQLPAEASSGPRAVPPALPGATSGAVPGPMRPAASDAPYCYQCGVQMQRAGSCFACPSCGTTSGCS